MNSRKLLTLFHFLLIYQLLPAQQVGISTVDPEFITPCGPPVTFSLTIQNNQAGALTAGLLTYSFPDGIEYVPGSAGGGGVAEASIVDLQAPVFSIPAIAGGQSISFSLQARADCDAADNNGNQNQINYESGALTVDGQSTLYNINLPAITFVNTSNLDYQGLAGETYVRGILLVNSGFGPITELTIVDQHGPSLGVLGVSPGTVLANGPVTEIQLTGADFAAVGDGDALLEQGEVIFLEETVQISGCQGSAGLIEVGWGCNGEVCGSFTLNTQVAVLTDLPDLKWEFGDVQFAGLCEDGWVEVLVVNDDVGAPVFDLILEPGITQLNGGNLPARNNCLRLSDFTIGSQNMTPDTSSAFTGYGIKPGQLTADPDGPGGLSDQDGDGRFDDLADGDTLRLWMAVSMDPACTSGPCFSELTNRAFRMRLEYENQCGQSFSSFPKDDSYAYSITPELFSSNLSLAYVGGEVIDVALEWTREIKGFACSDDSIRIYLLIPPTLEIPPGFQPTLNGLAAPFSIMGDTLVVIGDSPANLLEMQLVAQCDTSYVPVPGLPCSSVTSFPESGELIFWADYYCSAATCTEPVRLYCPYSHSFLVGCEDDVLTPPAGVSAADFFVRRLSLGWTDETLSQKVDPMTPGLALTTAMPYDTLMMEIIGNVYGVGNFDSTFLHFSYYAGVNNPFLNELADTLYFFDAETNTTYTCPDIGPAQVSSQNGVYLHRFPLAGLLEAGGCLDGLSITAGDQIVLRWYVQVSPNVPGEMIPVPGFQANFLFKFGNADLSCNSVTDSLGLIDPGFGYELDLEAPLLGCDTIEVRSNLQQGTNLSSLSDLFPWEFRPYSLMDSVRFDIPAGYSYLPGSSSITYEYRTGNAPSGPVLEQTVGVGDPGVNVNGMGQSVLTFANWSDFPIVDVIQPRTKNELSFQIFPDCMSDAEATVVGTIFLTKYFYSAADHLAQTRTLQRSIDYQIGERLFQVANPIYAGNSDTATWVLEVCDVTEPGAEPRDIPFNWLLFQSPDPDIQFLELVEVTDPGNPVSYPILPTGGPNQYWAQIDVLEGNDCRLFELRAEFAVCEPVFIPVSFDYDCGGYPSGPDPLGCDQTALAQNLQIQPQLAGLQANLVASPSGTVDLCSPLDYSIKVINTLQGWASDVFLTVDLPIDNGVFLTPGSVTIAFGNDPPIGIADPVVQPGGILLWEIDSLNPPYGPQGMPGVDAGPLNEFTISFQIETDCNFFPGSIFSYQAGWIDICDSLELTPLFFSQPLNVQGVPQSFNDYAFDLGVDTLQHCAGGQAVEATVVNLGDQLTNAAEVIRLRFDPGFAYVAGSTQGISNFPNASDPLATLENGEQVLEWPMPANIPIGDSIVFTFELEALSAGCGTFPLAIEVLAKGDVPCATAPQGFCALQFLEAGAAFELEAVASEWAIELTDLESSPFDLLQESVSVTYTLTNLTGPAVSGDLQIDLYFDENGNGQVDPGEPLLYAEILPATTLDPALPLSGQIDLLVDLAYACGNLLAVVDPANNDCTCLAASDDLAYGVDVDFGGQDSVCAGLPLSLGGASLQGYDFFWFPAGQLDDPLAESPTYAYTGAMPPSGAYLDTVYLDLTRGSCHYVDTFTVLTTQSTAELSATTDYNGYEISCAGLNDGALALTADGNWPPYVYEWSGGLSPDPVQTGLLAGVYAVTLTDANGCTADASIELFEPPVLAAAVTASDYQGFGVSCAGATDGSLVVALSGGVPAYDLQWDTGASGPDPGPIGAGTYSYIATDANGCQLFDTLSLTEPAPLATMANSSPVLCDTAGTATVEIELSGGVGPYQTGSVIFDPLYVETGIADPGEYIYEFVDANGCAISDTITIENFFSTFELQQQDLLCPAAADGQICVEAIVGAPPFQYQWSNGGDAMCIDGLSGGSYEVTVTDANGCSYVFSTDLFEPPPLALTLEAEAVSCFGGSDGEVSATASGATPPYDLSWSGGLSGPLQTGLTAGTYQLTLTDDHGCEWTDAVTVDQPPLLTVDLEAVDLSCFQSADGSIDVLANGGVPPYQYAWTGGLNGQNPSSLNAGSYSVTVFDANNCTAEAQATLTQPAELELILEETGISCFGENDGLIEVVSPLGEEYSYALNGAIPQLSTLFAGLNPGGYAVSLEDTSGCTALAEVFLSEPPEVLVEAQPDTAYLRLGESVELEALGHFSVESYLWTPALWLDCFDCAEVWATPLESTIYEVSVSTADGCTDSDRVVVIVEKPEDVYIPNAFSPNDDGYNDRFTVFAGPSVVRVNYLRIYHRWGGSVFEADDLAPNDLSAGWDGRDRGSGQRLNSGVFVYLCEVEYLDGRKQLFEGDVLLVR